ncbi:alpha/beta hydrolase [Leptospira gomenensis]|uniref:Alpha/beta hydrolase n=1 Tax=Leptospira gomenensis TaxID=2484974 RepID=A0A5F1YDY8_9LEPT|nr:alpha/beta hydrolase [Leptospira gomenensis]TGK33211.1 alpha/beta hydrolase [Leptospira gomenensis]TGK35556.1 alpha/beta hydrolase [Leptospira gomenensis]TGK40880.1 alpha/beta hydrolase [Leptospira gomenensis]TGK61170.1 alpha/beta hydrolase [Leptospira gomenensis]
MVHYEFHPSSVKSQKGSENVPILFVHGAWHGAWCWKENFVPYFQKAGFDVYSLDLRGHGKSPNPGSFRWNSIRDYADDVREVLDQLPDSTVLIGHSMGGFVVQKFLETRSVPKAVLLASVPPHGVFRITFELLLKHPIRFFRMIGTLSLFPIVEEPKLAQELLFSKSLSEEKAFYYASLIQNESFLAFLDMLLFRLPKTKRIKTPFLVLGGEKDRLFPPWEVKRTAKLYGAEAEIFPNMGHDMMLDVGWENVANRILRYLKPSLSHERSDLSKRKEYGKSEKNKSSKNVAKPKTATSPSGKKKSFKKEIRGSKRK